MSNKNWSFSNSFSWSNQFPQCDDSNQSPIDINTDLISKCDSMCDVKFHYKPSSCFLNFKNNMVTIKYASGSFIEYKNVLYELKNITIHTPTLHSIDNTKYDLELCLIHEFSSGSKASDSPNGIMICVLLSEGPNFGKPNEFINQIINDIPRETTDTDKEITVSNDWSANMVIPKNKSFYMYDGSKPFPPCDTNYKVVVFNEIATIGRSNLEMFESNIGENIRNIQPLNERQIMFNLDEGDKLKNKKQNSKNVSSDKFLRCVRSPLFKFQQNKKNKKTIEHLDQGLTSETKKKFKNFFLTCIIIVLFILSVILVKFLFKKKLIQYFILLLLNKESRYEIERLWETNCMSKQNMF